MSILGKFHEFSFYGSLTTIICYIKHIFTLTELRSCAFEVKNFHDFFLSYLFWTSILFIPLAIVGAFSTKYADYGKGLLFESDNIIVIIFAHIAEEILGLFTTPFWFLKDIFTHELNLTKIMDYSLYCIELCFICFGLLSLFHS